LVSGNSGPGIFLIDPTTTGNVIAGNLIGTTAGGTAGLGNTEDGIDIWQGAHDNTVGPDNVISGNRRNGILLGVDVSGTAIFGNLIGTNAAGTAALGNGEEGILLDWAPDNLIGGEAPGERNIIAGNASNGVLISGAVANDNVVAGNFIGTDITGAANLGNGSNGVVLENGAQNNLVGGDTVSERNIISGNEEHGICIKDAGTTDNVVWHNFIGTDSTGTATLGNTACGVYLDSGDSESVVRLNLISANLVGVCISGTATMSNTVFGNRIGTDVTGNSPLGNTLAGVYLTGGTHQNTVGGTYPEWNVISGNRGSGVIISGTGTVHNTLWGNMIGAAADSFMLMGNAENGVLIAAGAQHNTIGSENIIVGSPLDGVAVEGDDAYGNRITQNHILSNTLGIHLLGGANGGIAAPVITAVTTGSDPVTIQGTACAGCTVEVFGNVNDDGEGHIYLGSTVATGGNFSLTEDTHGLHYLTATATDAALGTSEFSSVYKIPYRVYLPLIVR
jgi:titin